MFTNRLWYPQRRQPECGDIGFALRAARKLKTSSIRATIVQTTSSSRRINITISPFLSPFGSWFSKAKTLSKKLQNYISVSADEIILQAGSQMSGRNRFEVLNWNWKTLKEKRRSSEIRESRFFVIFFQLSRYLASLILLCLRTTSVSCICSEGFYTLTLNLPTHSIHHCSNSNILQHFIIHHLLREVVIIISIHHHYHVRRINYKKYVNIKD